MSAKASPALPGAPSIRSWSSPRFRRPLKVPSSMRSGPKAASRACTTPLTAAPPGTSQPSPTAPATISRDRWCSLQSRMATQLPPSSGTPSAWCSSPRSVTTATTSRSTASPGPAWPRSQVPPPRPHLPQQYRRHRFNRVSHLSRLARSRSLLRRHLCLDRRREQPGPGPLAGSVQPQRQCMQQPDPYLRQTMEHRRAPDQHSPGWGHHRARRLQPRPGRGPSRSRSGSGHSALRRRHRPLEVQPRHGMRLA